jgi:hypothetical protein
VFTARYEMDHQFRCKLIRPHPGLLSIRRPMLHPLHLHVALSRRTNDLAPPKKHSFRNQEALDGKELSLFGPLMCSATQQPSATVGHERERRLTTAYGLKLREQNETRARLTERYSTACSSS